MKFSWENKQIIHCQWSPHLRNCRQVSAFLERLCRLIDCYWQWEYIHTRPSNIFINLINLININLINLKVILQLTTFLVFVRDVLFIPCSCFFFFLSFCGTDCCSITQKLFVASTSNFLCLCKTNIHQAVQNVSDLDDDLDEWPWPFCQMHFELAQYLLSKTSSNCYTS